MTAREVLARIIRGLVKVVTCAAGGAIAGVVIMLVFSSGLNPIFYESDWAGVVGSLSRDWDVHWGVLVYRTCEG